MDIIIPQKRCPMCKQFKPATNEFFCLNKYTLDGFKYQCKQCINEVSHQKSVLKRAAKGIPPGCKRCTVCKKIKPATTEYFARIRKSKEVLRPRCKACSKVEDATRASAKNERRKTLRRSDPIAAERMRMLDRLGVQRNAGVISKRKKAYYAANPNQRRVEAHRRRTRERASGEKYTRADVEQQYKNQKGKCYYCKSSVGKIYDVDHVIPISRGGANDKSNIVIACRTCNRSKQNKLPHEWPQGNRLL